MLSKEHSADVKPYSPPFSKALKMRRAYHRMSYLMYCVSRHKTLIHIVLFIYIQASPSGQARDTTMNYLMCYDGRHYLNDESMMICQ